MKKYTLMFAVILLGSSVAPKLNALEKLENWMGYGKHVDAKNVAGKVNSVEFWNAVIPLVEKKFGKNSPYAERAHSNLHKAQVRQSHKGLGTRGTSPKLKSKATRPETEREAFLKGKKSGEAHERRLLRKKAEGKTLKRRKPAATKTAKAKKTEAV